MPSTQAQFRRRIHTAPERVLDAPGLVDDYYLNLLDWSVSNQVAIGLERAVYVWNAASGTVAKLVESTSHINHVSQMVRRRQLSCPRSRRWGRSNLGL